MTTVDKQVPELRNLGRAARFLRARRELSQEVLGERAGLHRNYVGAIERGEINPTFRIMLKLTRGLDVPLSKLIDDFESRCAESSTSSAQLRLSGGVTVRHSASGLR